MNAPKEPGPWDRRFAEVLQELRVMQTGLQILFGFLLTLPFSAGFAKITGDQKVVYVVTLVASAAATAFLIAPVSMHRMLSGEGLKPQVVRTAAVMTQVGLVMLLFAIAGAVFLVMEVVSVTWAAVVVAVLAVLYIGLWYVVPLMHRLNR
ncbi:MAG: amine oxidase [Hamadaea sp.]|nr:amine oxidase [Hamadaea sp.]